MSHNTEHDCNGDNCTFCPYRQWINFNRETGRYESEVPDTKTNTTAMLYEFCNLIQRRGVPGCCAWCVEHETFLTTSDRVDTRHAPHAVLLCNKERIIAVTTDAETNEFRRLELAYNRAGYRFHKVVARSSDDITAGCTGECGHSRSFKLLVPISYKNQQYGP